MAKNDAFAFQDFEVYQRSLEAVVVGDRLSGSFRGVRGHLGWQLHRSVTSISLNIAEASGRYHSADKAQLYVVATGSALESAAILDIADRLDVGAAELREELRALLLQIVRMLVSLTRSLRRRT